MSNRLPKTAIPSRFVVRASLAGLALSVITGCAVQPAPIAPGEVRARVQADQFKIYAEQDPIFKAITFQEAVARSLKYNLDHRLKLMEYALNQGLADVANYEMLPSLLASAGYTSRNNITASRSFSINPDGSITESNPPTYTGGQEKNRATTSIDLSWSVLDFGVGYYRARQQANQVLIAEERRRRVVQNILSDVRSAYWRAAGAQRLTKEIDVLMGRARSALARSREAEAQGLLPPREALGYQRQLLDAVSLLSTRRQELDFAKRELAALMNVTPGTDFELADEAETELMPVPVNLAELEELALVNRPELRQEDYQVRVTADDVRKQMLGMFPNLSVSVGVQSDTNKYLYNDNWIESTARLSFNLLKTLSIPSLNRAHEAQVKTDDMRRMALSMAILTQTRVAVERYRLALNDLDVAEESNQVDQRLAGYARAAFTTRADSELELIRAETRAINSAFQRASAYASAQTAFGRIYNSIGLEVVPDDIQGESLDAIGSRIVQNIKQIESETFVRITAPTQSLPPLRIELSAAAAANLDADMLKGASAAVAAALKRNQIATGGAETGHVLQMAFDIEAPQNSTRRAHWTLRLIDANGKELGSTRYSSALPLTPSQRTVSAFAEAAIVSNLRTLRHWHSIGPDGLPLPAAAKP